MVVCILGYHAWVVIRARVISDVPDGIRKIDARPPCLSDIQLMPRDSDENK